MLGSQITITLMDNYIFFATTEVEHHMRARVAILYFDNLYFRIVKLFMVMYVKIRPTTPEL